jgi:hypothetical protein
LISPAAGAVFRRNSLRRPVELLLGKGRVGSGNPQKIGQNTHLPNQNKSYSEPSETAKRTKSHKNRLKMPMPPPSNPNQKAVRPKTQPKKQVARLTPLPGLQTDQKPNKSGPNRGFFGLRNGGPPDRKLNFFPKRYCQSQGPRLNCSRSYEQRGSKPLSSSARWVEAETIFNHIFRRLKGRFSAERLKISGPKSGS